MKSHVSILRVISLLLLLLAVGTIPLVGCDSGNPTNSETTAAITDPPPAPSEFSLIVDGKTTFTVVRAENAKAETRASAIYCRTQLNEITQMNFPITTDWDEKGVDNSKRPEILIGNTNRPQTATAIAGLGIHDYIVTVVDGKIVIWGGNDNALNTAIDHFLDMFVRPTPNAPIIQADYRFTSKAQSLTMIDGVIYKMKQVSCATNRNNADRNYIVKNNAYANDAIRYCDLSSELIYKFDIAGLIEPSVTLNLSQAFKIEISADNKDYVLFYNSPSGSESGAFTIKPFDHKIYDTLYIRLSDPTPENGGGAAISSFRFASYEEGADVDNMYYLEDSVKEIVQQLSVKIPATPVEGYQIHEDGGMIYNPISADKKDYLNKYDDAECFTGTVEISNGATLEYSIPKNVTAYDAVPIRYRLTANRTILSSNPIHISATANDDIEITGDQIYYDLNLPGKIEVTYQYEGYVVANVAPENRPVQDVNFTGDIIADFYPDYQPSDLIYSGSVPKATYTWYKFTYTNTGNTILDNNGNGAFTFHPRLYRKNTSGEYELYSDTANIYYRLEEDLYPGQSGTLWVLFLATDYPTGDYCIELNGEARYEENSPERFEASIWSGKVATSSRFEFKVTSQATVTEPNPVVVTQSLTNPTRNTWLHSYEEFMSSFITHRSVAKGTTTTGVLYLQCAPWTNQVVLRLIDGSTMDAISIPVQVESDSITITFNPNNNNYVELDDGTRYPAIMAQNMADMRINITQGPDAAANVTKYISEIADLGFNVVNSTAGFIFDSGNGGNAFSFSMDVLRKTLNLRMEGFVSYPFFNSGPITAHASRISGKQLDAGGVTSKALGIANAYLAKYQFERWGDTYWVVDGNVILSVEDSRGGTYIGTQAETSMQERSLQMDSESLYNFSVFCQSLYGTIKELNKAWGSSYKSFYDINPYESCSNTSKSIFGSWSRALSDLDSFRTLERAYIYKVMLDELSETIPNAQIDMRLEGSNWFATVPYDTKNPRYRHTYYDQRAGAIIPELLDRENCIQYISVYTWDAYRPSEVAELTAGSIENGITPAMLPLFNHMREIALNSKYGRDFSALYNLSGTDVYAVQVNTVISLFEWWKATYEAGGVPGILYSDYTTDGVASSVQKKEIRFFMSKLAEAMQTPEAQEWMTEFENDDSILDTSRGKMSYDEQFVEDCIAAYRDSLTDK